MDIVKTIVAHIEATRRGAKVPTTVSVASEPGGRPLGAPPAIGAGGRVGNPWAGGGGWMDRGTSRAVEAPEPIPSLRVPGPSRRAVIAYDVRSAAGAFEASHTADALWEGPRPAMDLLGRIPRRRAVDSYASLKAWGSSDVASGPEGTIVLMPFRIPRSSATARSTQGARAGNRLLNYANDRVGTPDVPVIR